MVKFYAHSLFSITFFVVRFFILDAAASPAYAGVKMHELNSNLETNLSFPSQYGTGDKRIAESCAESPSVLT